MINKNQFELIIREELLNDFCKINDFVIITDDMLKKNNMYKELVYATNDNFIGKSVYPSNMPILINKEVNEKLIKVNSKLKEYGLCLKIYDAYRPIQIQKIFWEEFYNTNGFYDELLIANPNKYGTHNITINAVDILPVNLDGTDIELPCKFDDFTGKASISYNNCSEKEKYNRDLLISICAKYGLIVNKDEWWHFYDNRLKEYGMTYNYAQSEFIPKKENEVFVLKEVN